MFPTRRDALLGEAVGYGVAEDGLLSALPVLLTWQLGHAVRVWGGGHRGSYVH